MPRRLVVAAALLFPAVALACLNAVRLETKEAARLVAKAESALEAGQAPRALRLLEDDVQVRDAALARRINLLRAVAQVRTGQGSTALPTLRFHLDANPDDPVLKARVAEALLVARRGDRAEALRLVADLEERDLMPDAEAWVTLARLRDGAGDAPGRDRALGRCRAVARRPELCVVAPTKPAAPPAPKAPARRLREARDLGDPFAS